MMLRTCAREGVEIGALGQVLPDEPVGVLVESALPGMVGWAAGACSRCVSSGLLDEAWKRYAARVFHKMGQGARGTVLLRFDPPRFSR